jgi:hypothetical protein
MWLLFIVEYESNYKGLEDYLFSNEASVSYPYRPLQHNSVQESQTNTQDKWALDMYHTYYDDNISSYDRLNSHPHEDRGRIWVNCIRVSTSIRVMSPVKFKRVRNQNTTIVAVYLLRAMSLVFYSKNER